MCCNQESVEEIKEKVIEMSATVDSLQLSISELQKWNRHLHEVKVSHGYHNSYTMPKLDYVTLKSTIVSAI